MHEYDHAEPHQHSEDTLAVAHSARKNIIGNRISSAVKIIGGLLFRDPVLVSDGAHDVGDALIHGDHEKEALSENEDDTRKYAVRSAIKLGSFSMIGAGVETAVEKVWEHAPNHPLGLVFAIGGFAMSRYFKKDAHRHSDEKAFSLKSHTFWDQMISGTTLANAGMLVAGVAVNPLIPLGLHLGFSFTSSWQIYRNARRHTH